MRRVNTSLGFCSVDGSPLTIPALVICNRMPFSQDGVNSVNGNLRQDPAMRYLLEWTNPSLREDADYVTMSQSYMNQGQTILFQYLPQNIRNHSINQMQYACQSVINSCSYQVRMLFMSRNSWYSQQTTPIHPGIDIFLRENTDDVVALVHQLENPIRLLDKKGIRLRMRKEKKADTRRSHCGQTLGEAVSADRSALENNRTNFLLCTIMVSIHYCECHPLIAEMIPLDIRNYRDFSVRVNSTQVCTVEQYEACSRRYIDITRPSAWTDAIPSDMPGAEEILECRRENSYPCEVTSYRGIIDQYDLPAAYQSTQDYVSRLVLEYSTMRVTEVLVSKDPSLYELLSYIGYNIATWFAIGHIIWSVYVLIRDALCCSNKVRDTK
ncbi:hypothetical protein ANCCAN_23817 [Ancylostoma caninum]|uniref:Amiloride-sensitive sodium channel n=1 Tax=Ancylostoma caninum TaxID=29170 RepID=A0A368FE12_ANCCA|nr:hypothetical protein ANCCAN_23817 [Ancylostoma caninum]